MIKNTALLEKFEREMIKEPLSYRKALQIFEAMWKEEISLGVLPLKNPLEGI